MAGKARRAAARQGELARRRKKGQRGPSGVPSSEPHPTQRTSNGSTPALAMEAAGAVASAAAAAEPEQRPQVAAPVPQPAAQPRAQGRQRGERPAAYNYVGTELRRIGVLATAVVAVLVALSFVF